MIELIDNMEEKNSLVVIDGEYLTWLEEIKFNYLSHTCKLPYLKFIKYKTDKERNTGRNKSHNHIDYTYSESDDSADEKNVKSVSIQNRKQFMIIRYNFEYLMKQIKLNDSLIIFDLKNDKIKRYIIKSWVNQQSKNDVCVFSIEKLYKLYKEYSFYDIRTEFSEHESGYTYINFENRKFKNTENTIRNRLGLKTWKTSPVDEEYRDVRVYRYFDYISRISKYENQRKTYENFESMGTALSTRLFKYRRLNFESYLYCHFMQKSIPSDLDRFPEWKKLGKTLEYIKVSDGTLPMFIKAEWIPESTLKIDKTWRRA